MFVNRSPRTPKSGTAAPAFVADVVRQSGTPLDAPTRAFMESRFNQSFGAVRIHAAMPLRSHKERKRCLL
jgi:hypothetical protein